MLAPLTAWEFATIKSVYMTSHTPSRSKMIQVVTFMVPTRSSSDLKVAEFLQREKEQSQCEEPTAVLYPELEGPPD